MMKHTIRYIFTIFVLLSVVSSSALAATEAQTAVGNQAMGKNGHMKKMEALRQTIPARYKAMKNPPTPFGESDLAWGKAIFAEYCARCHGVHGRGDGPLSSKFASPVPDFVNGHHASFFNAGEKFWIVTNGFNGTPMPAFGGRLTERQRWLAVGYVLELSQGGKGQ